MNAHPIIVGNDFATLHDIGDGVACFRAHTKMNTFDPGVFDILESIFERAHEDFQALILANDDPRAFSAGADLTFFIRMLDGEDGPRKIADYGKRGQGLFLRMLRAPFPVVAAVHGFALGGGCEFQMHADAVIAHAEANIGLPETGVGLVPGWGGCTRLFARNQALHPAANPVEIARLAFRPLFSGKICGSAEEARSMGLLQAHDAIVTRRDMLADTAKQKALSLLEGYAPQVPVALRIAGATGKAQFMEGPSKDLSDGRITETDFALAEALADILTGGSAAGGTITEEEMMALEAETLARLVSWPPSRARVEHLLSTGKQLRN